jgi:hypothetical protein
VAIWPQQHYPPGGVSGQQPRGPAKPWQCIKPCPLTAIATLGGKTVIHGHGCIGGEIRACIVGWGGTIKLVLPHLPRSWPLANADWRRRHPACMLTLPAGVHYRAVSLWLQFWRPLETQSCRAEAPPKV